MDQDDGHLEENEQLQGDNYEGMQDLAIGALEEYIAMDVMEEDSDIDSEPGDAVDDDDESSDDVHEEIMEQDSWSSDEYYDDSDSTFQVESTTACFQQLHRMLNRYREQTKPNYSFKPLRLIRCQYKSRHDVGEFPIARSGHRIIASESHLYSLGGYNPKRTPNNTQRDACMLFQELWAYNFATSRWKLLLDAENSAMPRELASNALVIYNNVLIVSTFMFLPQLTLSSVSVTNTNFFVDKYV
uniref:Uncharacterized protein n=1 Tax=Stomoxys calcitrans TaxID=35570 RepID=A0A1I8P483_STOCA